VPDLLLQRAAGIGSGEGPERSGDPVQVGVGEPPRERDPAGGLGEDRRIEGVELLVEGVQRPEDGRRQVSKARVCGMVPGNGAGD